MFNARLTDVAREVQSFLNATIDGLPEGELREAMRYSVQGGKRLRAFLVMESARLHNIPESQAIWPAAAIECLHAYSLVHDDLPCMDDDDLRRGLPTVHKKWDDATAVLVGDALQSLAFALVSAPEVSTDPSVRADLALSLAQASGAAGMVYGQALDIAAETSEKSLTLPQITALQAGKTGALIRWSACAGARLAQADTSALDRYASDLGLAFQIADDILDVEGDEELAGKRLNKDAEAGKATFVSLLGLEEARSRAKSLVADAEAALAGYGDGAETLKQAARFVIARRN